MRLEIQRFTNPTSVTAMSITAFNTAVAFASTPATADVADTTQEFSFTCDTPRPILYLENGGDADGEGFTCEIKSGSYSFAQVKSVFVDYGSKVFVELEEGYNKDASEKIVVKLTPETGKKLKTDCVAKVGVLKTL